MSRVTYVWVVSHMNGSCYLWVCHTHTHTHMVGERRGLRGIYQLTMEDSNQFHIWMSLVTWLIHMWHDLSIRDMTHTHVTWPIHMWHDAYICDMTHTYVTWRITDSAKEVTLTVTRHIHMWHDSYTCDMTHTHGTWRMNMGHDSYIWDMSHTYVI